MKFAPQQVILLGRDAFTIQEYLGAGAISLVYRATPIEMPGEHVIVKVLKDDDAQDDDKAQALRNEAEVLARLNQAEDPHWANLHTFQERFEFARQTARNRHVIAGLANGELAGGQPASIQETAPPAFERFVINSWTDERRLLSIAESVVSTMTLAHESKLAFKDFEPVTKGDRIRLNWLDERGETFELKIIDWNITGGPEDFAQDLLYLGGHLFYFLVGQHITYDQEGRPPARLGHGLPAWENLTEGTRQLLSRLLNRDARLRYVSANNLLADLHWWLDALQAAEKTEAYKRLDEKAWQANTQDRYDRVLATTDLAGRLVPTPPAEILQTFKQLADKARRELGKEVQRILNNALFSLGTRAFSRAAQEFAEIIRTRPEESPENRAARFYRRQAEIAVWLQENFPEADVLTMPVWTAIEHAVRNLTDGKVDSAKADLAQAETLVPAIKTGQSFIELQNQIEANTWALKANQLRDQGRFMPVELNLTDADWVRIEQEHLQNLERAIDALRQATALAPDEPEFRMQYESELSLWRNRQEASRLYAAALQTVKAGRKIFSDARAQAAQPLEQIQSYQIAVSTLASALDSVNAILNKDASHIRAARLRDELQKDRLTAENELKKIEQTQDAQIRYERQIDNLRKLMAQGHYSKAFDLALEVREFKADSNVDDILELARMGKQQFAAVQDYITSGLTHLNQLATVNLTNIHQLIETIEKLRLKPLILGSKSLPFIWSAELEESFETFKSRYQAVGRIQDQNQKLTTEAYTRINLARQTGDWYGIQTELSQLTQRRAEWGVNTLEAQEQAWKDEASHHIELEKHAHDQLLQLEQLDRNQLRQLPLTDQPDQGFAILKEVYSHLSNYSDKTRAELTETACAKWDAQLKELPADTGEQLEHIRQRLKENPFCAVSPAINTILKDAQQVWQGLHKDSGLTSVQLDVWSEYLQILERLIASGWPRLRIWAQTEINFVREKLKIAQLLSSLREIGQRSSQAAGGEVDQAYPGLLAAVLALSRQDILLKQLSPSERHEISQIVNNHNIRAAAQGQLAQLREQLRFKQLSWSQANSEAKKIELPVHPAILANDLRLVVNELEDATRLEIALKIDVQNGDYQTAIGDLRRIQSSVQRRTGSELFNQLVAQVADKEKLFGQTLQNQFQALNNQVPNIDLTELIGLYSQARWYELENNRQSLAPLSADIQLTNLTRKWEKAIRQVLQAGQSLADLQQAGEYLNNLSNLGEAVQTLLKDNAPNHIQIAQPTKLSTIRSIGEAAKRLIMSEESLNPDKELNNEIDLSQRIKAVEDIRQQQKIELNSLLPKITKLTQADDLTLPPPLEWLLKEIEADLTLLERIRSADGQRRTSNYLEAFIILKDNAPTPNFHSAYRCELELIHSQTVTRIKFWLTHQSRTVDQLTKELHAWQAAGLNDTFETWTREAVSTLGDPTHSITRSAWGRIYEALTELAAESTAEMQQSLKTLGDRIYEALTALAAELKTEMQWGLKRLKQLWKWIRYG